MTADEEKRELQLLNIKKKLSLYFPEDSYSFTKQAIEDGIASGEFMTTVADILPYVQTALFDNKILEVEIDGTTRIYFSRIHDDTPDPEEVVNELGEVELQQLDYVAGDYLKLLNHIICLPLEPGMGNLHIRNSQRVMIRFFTTTSAIELGTFFQDLALVQDLPVLRLSFPVIGRQVQGARAFRAKVPASMGFTLLVKGKKKHRPDIKTVPIDISSEGLSFEVQKEEQLLFREDEICNIRFFLLGDMHVKVNATIRHISKIRNKKGIQYCCGVQFDLSTRSLAASIEAFVATVQRAHLKELSEKSEESGITLIR
ncbi:PilZ domain-containing protein [Desulfocapsa sulfexigens DSM 10523]|uniref:PilZ domain-containing protein n=1 Tax=Desulfocapsa sulfexigens (strain DSM 10523 / SB164P1) TaxID=1167006 RepID=M1PJR2_DESSD|nr:PilZ domain-containing protein [Desulfocapsa sulfexigens]AGF76746.1 PilZ domain-containing protein [Desulfocapsa sulfexigens DSM 10523]